MPDKPDKWSLPKWMYPGLQIKRWIAVLLSGVTVIGLGIAYLLAEFYTQYELPEIFYYLTLQFIDQIVRGIIFIALGMGLILYGLKKLLKSVATAIVPDQDDNLFNLVYERRRATQKPRVVVFANGMGLFLLTAALKDVASRIDVVLPMGEDKNFYKDLLQLNRLVLQQFSVAYIPDGTICAQYDDDVIEKGLLTIKESRRRGNHITRMFVDSENGAPEQGNDANAEIIAAIAEADHIIFGPSSLHVGVIPSLLASDVSGAVVNARAKKIFVCNIMTEPGKTENYSVSDHVKFLNDIGGFGLDYIVLNNRRVDFELWEKYSVYGASQVLLDLDEFENTILKVDMTRTGLETRTLNEATLIESDLISTVTQVDALENGKNSSTQKLVVRHDAEKLQQVLSQVLYANR